MRPAVFLDRDGTINRDPGYLTDPELLQIFEDVPQALRLLQLSGYALVVVTNQSGVARGCFTEHRLADIHGRLLQLLGNEGIVLDGIYYCPHHPYASLEVYRRNCNCRKPEPGLLLQAAQDLELDLARSVMVGDSISDIQAGRRAGCGLTVLVRASYPPAIRSEDSAGGTPDFITNKLGVAAQWIISKQEGRCF